MWATDKKVSMLDKLEIDGFNKPLLSDKVKKQSIEGRVIVLCLSTFFFGFVLTQISLISPAVWYNQFGFDMTREDFIGPCFGLIPLGAALGTIFNHFAMNRFNRRIYLVIANILSLIVTGGLQMGGILSLFIFRIFQGIICGIWMSFIPTYIGQLTPRELGSRFGVYPQISVVLGVLVSFTVGMIMTNCFDFESLPSGVPIDSIIIPNWQASVFWRVMFGIGLLPSIVQLICVMIGYIPQSPYSLINKNRREEAEQVLALFYEEEYIHNIIAQKEKIIHEDLNVTIDAMTIWRPKGLYIGFQLVVFQALTGITSYVTQTGHFVAVTLEQPIFGIYTPIVITIAQLIGTFISIPLLQVLEWKSLTIIGGFSLSIFNAFTAALLYLFKNDESFQPYAMTLAAVSIVAFMFIFGATVGSSVWPYVNYMMPSGVMLVAQVTNWLLSGLSIIAFSFVLEAQDSPVIMLWVYTGATFVFTILNWIFMIDIKGLSVVKVQQKIARD